MGAERSVWPLLESRKCAIVPLPSKPWPMEFRPTSEYQNSL